ncbi:MAG: SCO family protein [Planctomycetes bacterium]|nr:SCO family protein [Planctomycetota bacterium]
MAISILGVTMAVAGVACAAAEANIPKPAVERRDSGAPSGPTISGQFAGAVIQQAGIAPKFGQQLPPDVKFVDADGKTIQLDDCFAGRPVILHLVYYECPMLCKLSSDGLLSTLSTLSLKPGEDFTIMTLSFDPREGPELSARARELAITRCGKEAVHKGWHFLTGDQPAIAAVTDAVGFRYVYDENTNQYAHASGIFVLTPDGTVSRYLGGIDYSPRDLRFALVEASDGKVGTAADQVLMLCYMYDPTVGKYGFAIMTVIRAAGVLTVVALAASIIMMVRRERRRMADVVFCHSERSEESVLQAGADPSLRSG